MYGFEFRGPKFWVQGLESPDLPKFEPHYHHKKAMGYLLRGLGSLNPLTKVATTT